MDTTAIKLAIDGGSPVASEPFPGPWLGPAEIGEEEVAEVTKVLRSGQIFRFHPGLENSYCSQLENLFREMTGCEYALAVGGGTAALICGLVGAGIGDGDEVLIPGHTYIASASSVLIAGGIPVLVEVDESLNMDPADIESKITSRTRAILPVHMRGVPCKMDEILEIADNHNLMVIEDVAQACGGTYKGKPLGSFGKVGCFSLQQYKIITAGEGGMVVTNDRRIYERAAVRHDSAMCFWRSEDSVVDPFPGENFRMNEMEGALGVVQFGRMEGILSRLRTVKKRIVEALADLPQIRLQDVPDPEGDCSVALIFFVADEEICPKFSEALQAEGIPAGSVYDKGIPDRHVFPYWEYVMGKLSADRHGRPWTSPLHDPSREYHPKMLPRTLSILGRSIVIPLSQTYSDRHIDWIIEAVRKVAAGLEKE
jgi:8-amino-3,8-dideoxy-alpha-D-manno-octulosonate transaminase